MDIGDVDKYTRAAEFVDMFPLKDPEEVYAIAMNNDDDELVLDQIRALEDRKIEAPADGAVHSDDDTDPPAPVLLGRQHEDPVAAAPDAAFRMQVEIEVKRLTTLNNELEKKCDALERENELLRNNVRPEAHPAPHPTVLELQAELGRQRVAVQRAMALKADLEVRCNELLVANIQLRANNNGNDEVVARPLQLGARKVEQVNFEMEKGDFTLRAPSTATKPLATTAPAIVKLIESREFSLDSFRVALDDAGKAALLTVDAVDIADEFTAFGNGRRFIPVLFEVYSTTPASLAVLLWNFNIESTVQYRRRREDILGTFARCYGFIQTMKKLLDMRGDVPEVVAWVLTILWPLSADFRSPRFVELADQVSEEDSELNTFAEGFQLLTQLKSIRTGVDHEVVLWNTHDNDPFDFRRVDLLPLEQELTLGAYPAGGLPQGQLSRLKFDVVHETAGDHLDRHFRLLREDQVATLRASYADMSAQAAGDKKKQKSRSVTLTNCKLTRVEDVFTLAGKVNVTNKHPLTKGGGNAWLKQSRSFFSMDTIVFLQGNDKVVLGVVMKQTTLAKNQNVKPNVMLEVVIRCDPSFVPLATDKYVAVSSTVQWKNVSYVLRSLQHMMTLPFTNQIVHLRDEPALLPPTAEQLQQLNADGKLTDRQHQAIRQAITQKMTLIQGPPGTGKTFVGTRLVEALSGPTTWRQGDGVVIILAYTNHALDQLLLRLYDRFKEFVNGNEGAVTPLFLRLGSPESAKEDGVKKFMHDIRGDVERGLYNQLKNRQRDAISQLTATPQSMASIAAELHRQYACLRVTDKEFNFWTTKAADPKFKWAGKPDEDFFWKLWCSGIVNQADDDSFKKNFKLLAGEPQLAARLQIFKIPVEQRRTVMEKVHAHQAGIVSNAAKNKMSIDDQMDEARQAARARAIPPAVRIVGATTSFGAKNQVFLKALTARYPNSTLLIEEAGEILEGHILACLEEKLRRVVMIGDHKQLPPKVEQYIFQRSSGKGYDLNCSMFQRMIEGGYPYIALDEQHRMFPALSQILRKLSYPDLNDAAEIATQKVTPIPGFEHQMMFFDHEFKESGGQDDSDSVSKCNPKEADFVVRTAKYLSQQPDVKLNQMVILTPYLGQVKVIRECVLKAGFKAALNDRDVAEMSDNDGEDDEPVVNAAQGAGSIRVSTIDNFQGEEADYVFVSLVRCNKEGTIGWLKEAPRLTVLLSRAKKGLLLFGSRSTMTAKRSCWDLVFEKLDCRDNLSLKCSRHQHRFKVATVADFNRLSPEGGCNQVCAAKMDCGHHCSRKCHRGDKAHKQAMQHCREHTTVTCSNNHVIDVECAKVYKKTDAEICKVCHVCQEIHKVEAEAAKELKAIKDKVNLEAQRREVERKKLQKNLQTKEAELAALAAKDVLEAEKEASRIKIDGLQREIDGAKERMKLQVDAIRQATADEKGRVEGAIQELERRTNEQVDKIREASAKAVQDTHALQEQARVNNARQIADAVATHAADIEREKAILGRLQAPIDRDSLKQCVPCQSCGENDLLIGDAKVCRGGVIVADGEDRHCHYFHAECFDAMIESQINEPEQALKGEVLCLYCKAAKVEPPEAAHIPSHLVQLFASVGVAKKYDKHRLDAHIAKGEREGEARVRDQIAAESERDRIFRELCEDKNAKCPRCSNVFYDYNGCSALTCASCHCGFCALCFEDCGQDAHTHVARCPLNPEPGNVFLHPDVFKAANELRGQQIAFDVLITKKPALQTDVWEKLFDGQPMPARRPARRP